GQRVSSRPAERPGPGTDRPARPFPSRKSPPGRFGRPAPESGSGPEQRTESVPRNGPEPPAEAPHSGPAEGGGKEQAEGRKQQDEQEQGGRPPDRRQHAAASHSGRARFSRSMRRGVGGS